MLDDSFPRYLPHRQHPQLLHMGMSALDPVQWIELDNRLPQFHQHKQDVYARAPQTVYRWLPDSLPAQHELAQRLIEYLLLHYPQHYQRVECGIRCKPLSFTLQWPADPARAGELLWQVSQLIADDLVLMLPGSEGYLVAAASLCSPSHWRLEHKFGQPLRAVHAPVPGMATALDGKIDRFFAHLKVDRPVQRFNWSLQADAELFHDGRSVLPPGPDAPLFYRVERQTLRRLPDTGAVVFSIRVYLHPLECLAQIPGAMAELLAAIDAAPQALAAYKGFDRLAPALARFRSLVRAD